MSASELIPTTSETTEYREESSIRQGQDSVYLQMLEQIRTLTETVTNQANTIAELTRELDWFRRNMFGKKSETAKRFDGYEGSGYHQLSIFDDMSEEQKLMLGITEDKSEEKITVNSYKRNKSERQKKRTREELLANAKKGEDKLIYASDEEKICELWLGTRSYRSGTYP